MYKTSDSIVLAGLLNYKYLYLKAVWLEMMTTLDDFVIPGNPWNIVA